MIESLRELLSPLGFAESQRASFLRRSDAGRVTQIVAPYRYDTGRLTVEVGFLCPELTALALPELNVSDPPEITHCDAGLGFSFRLETLLKEPRIEGWDEADALARTQEHLVSHLEALCLRYATLAGWSDYYDERLERYGGAMDWACFAWVQLVSGGEAERIRHAIGCFAAGERGRFPGELERLRDAFADRFDDELPFVIPSDELD